MLVGLLVWGAGAILLGMILPHPALRMASLVLLASGVVFVIADAARVAACAGRDYVPRRYNRWYVYVVYLLVMWYVVQPVFRGAVKGTIAEAVKNVSGAMSPTLLPGDYLYVAPRLGRPVRRGEVAVARSPQGFRFLQRVVGLPGDTLEMRAKVLYRNGRAQSEPYTRHIDPATDPSAEEMMWQAGYLVPGRVDPAEYHPSRDHWGPIVVPAGRYFLLGDNRDNSQDSRYLGFIPDGNVVGQASWVYLSWDAQRMSVRWERLGSGIQ